MMNMRSCWLLLIAWARRARSVPVAAGAIMAFFFVAVALSAPVTARAWQAASPNQPYSDQPVAGIRAAVTSPFSVRGGVLMVPLTASQPGRNWPAALELQFADGTSRTGTIAWVTSELRPHQRHWADEARPLRVRPIEPGDTTDPAAGRPSGTPMLLVDLPSDGSREITLQGGHVLTPVWLDPPSAPSLEGLLPPPRFIRADDKPDPTSPFAYWRWCLVAERLGTEQPDADVFGQPGSQIARAMADLWLVGLRRLQRIDPALATGIIDALTDTCVDRTRAVASWVTSPDQLDALLSILLNQRVSASTVAAEVDTWLEGQRPILLWATRLYGQTVQVAIMNRGREPIDLSFNWHNADSAEQMVRVRPGEFRHIDVPRPAHLLDLPFGSSSEDQPLLLDVRFGTQRSTVQFPPLSTVARPPGAHLPGLHLPLTLADVETTQQPLAPETHQTSVHIRHRSGRWEVFFECRRPVDARVSSSIELPPMLRNPEDLRGYESIAILIDRNEAVDAQPRIMLVVPEQGWWKLPLGENDGTLQIHRRSYDDRWLCRIVLPRPWLGISEPDHLRISFVRGHSDNQTLQIGPGRTPPWLIDPARLHLDLSQWDQ